MAKSVAGCNFRSFNGGKNIRAEEQKILNLYRGRKSAFFKRNKSIIALTAQAGAYSSSAYAAISKIIALQAIWTKGFSPWNQ